MFAFIIITYNHGKYIIEHLESIKFQIENYSLNEVILIASDDCSTDNTVELIKKWSDKNKSLFSDIRIITSDVNKGIVQNYIRVVREIPCEKFKILAGDDLYYKNNILDALADDDFVLSPVIRFSNEGFVIPLKSELKRINSMDKLRAKLKTGNVIVAPGVFLSKGLIKDQSLLDFISGYKWIEDYPTWYYLFIKKEKKIRYRVTSEPYVLYRHNVGISGNKSDFNNNKKMFLIERNEMYCNLGIKRESPINKYFKPINYYYKFSNIFSYWFELINMYVTTKQDVVIFYRTIKKKAEEFYNDL